MRIMLVDHLYEGFLLHVYGQSGSLMQQSFAEQQAHLGRQFFPSAHYWDKPLRDLGHEVLSVSVNNPFAQVRWCLENNRQDVLKQCSDQYQFGQAHLRFNNPQSWVSAIAAEQVGAFRPDILYCGNMDFFGDDFLTLVRPHYGIAVGQHASPVPRIGFETFDLIISSLPNLVAHFRSRGLRSEYLKLAFDHRIIEHLDQGERACDLGFLGQVSADHRNRAVLLRALASAVDVDFWGNDGWEGPGADHLRLRKHQPAWGLGMYRNMRSCRMVVNNHIDVAGAFANNLRLFEATGVGTCLLTDWKSNLGDLFDIGSEVLAYRDADEAIRHARHFLAHDAEREAIAAAGQARILKEHTFAHRAHELVGILSHL